MRHRGIFKLNLSINFKEKMRFLFLVCLGLPAMLSFGQQTKTLFFYPFDINADGVRDILVTETVFDQVQTKNGVNQVFHEFTAKAFYGSSVGLANTASWILVKNDSIQSLSNFN